MGRRDADHDGWEAARDAAVHEDSDGVRAEGEPQLAAGAHRVVCGRERVDDRGAFGP